MKITFVNILLVALGGAVGSVLRFVSSVVGGRFEPTTDFPMATLAVNIVGCLVIGFLMGANDHRQWLDQNMKLTLVTGFCGGYTTFSTFSFECLQLFAAQRFGTMILYISLSLLLGFAAAATGYYQRLL